MGEDPDRGLWVPGALSARGLGPSVLGEASVLGWEASLLGREASLLGRAPGE